MADVVAVLLVPSKTAREALLGDGPCEAHPPVLRRYTDEYAASLRNEAPELVRGFDVNGFWGWRVGVFDPSDRDRLYAIALWWNNRPVFEGWDRFRRVLSAQGSRSVFLGLESVNDLADLMHVLDAVVPAAVGGRVVLLDAAGVEVAGG